MGNSLDAGFQEAYKLTRKHAKTFYFASRFLPKQKRYAAYSVYSICRISDDSVDQAKGTVCANRLEDIKRQIEAAYGNTQINQPILLAFRKTVNKYGIPKEYFDELTNGIETDLNKNRYENYNELYSYCHKVAGVVGLIMLKVFGYNDRRAEKHAIDLGIAMQLTNILRDIKEDYQRKRIYLPKDEMASFAVTEQQIAQERLNSNFIELLKFQIRRARRYYDNSVPGIRMITDRQSRLVVCLMKNIYAGILKAIEKNDYNIFAERARTTTTRKVGIALKVLLKGQYL